MNRLAAGLAVATLVPFVASAPLAPGEEGGWPQFGGPSRDFRVEASGLGAWGAEGPRTLWERELGEGYSGIVADGGVLFTMYRPLEWLGLRTADEERVIAIDAASGRTLWEQANPVAVRPSMDMEYGLGPHSTPLVVGGRVFAVGVVGRLQALDAKTGTILWSRELWKELEGEAMYRGYTCSPLAWRDTVIVAVGGAGQGLVAFDQQDGSIRWRSPTFALSLSSPVLVDVAGQEQVVFFAFGEVMGFDPDTGRRLWSHPHETSFGLNIALPVTGDDGMLVVSSAYDSGTRALRLSRVGDTTEVEELWFTPRLRVHHGNMIRIGDHVYGSNGNSGPGLLTALDLRTGELVWRKRAFGKAKLVFADGRLIVLDEDGNLGLVTASPEGLEVQARAEVFSGRSWTAPTLVGTRLYLRDRKQMKALDLGR